MKLKNIIIAFDKNRFVRSIGCQILSLRFQGSDDFAVTGYDMKDILIFKKNSNFKN
jgi:hypothetical protein